MLLEIKGVHFQDHSQHVLQALFWVRDLAETAVFAIVLQAFQYILPRHMETDAVTWHTRNSLTSYQFFL